MGHHWPSEQTWGTYNSSTLRRGFKVWQRACQGCHGAMHQKYDLIVDKGFKQRELMDKMVFFPKVHPGHQKYRGDYFQEWDYRQRVIHDRMWPPYLTVHQAKNANMGVWPPDLSKALTHNPGLINYSYNLMIIAMPPQLHDGMIEYEDGVPSSAPQMAHDVSEYLMFVSRARVPDQKIILCLALAVAATIYPISYMFTKYHYVNCYSH